MTTKSKLKLVPKSDDPTRTVAIQIADDLDAAIKFAFGLEFAIIGSGGDREPLHQLATTLTAQIEHIRARFEDFRRQLEAEKAA
jgi:hypothetical protein